MYKCTATDSMNTGYLHSSFPNLEAVLHAWHIGWKARTMTDGNASRFQMKEIPEPSSKLEIFSMNVANKIKELEARLTLLENKINNENAGDAKDSILHHLMHNVTGVIGLKESVTAKNNFVRCIWVILLALGIAATIFFMYSTATGYLAEPTLTKVSMNETSAYRFPSVYLCPIGWYDVEWAKSQGLSLEGLRYSMGYYKQLKDKQAIKNTTQGKQDFLTYYKARNYSSLFHFYEAIAHNLTTVFSDKEFDKRSNTARLYGNGSRYLQKSFKRTRICHAYDFPSANLAWSVLGLEAKITDNDEEMRGNGAGWKLLLSNNPGLFTQIIPEVQIAPFTSNKIRISVKNYVTLDKPDAKCLSDAEDQRPSGYATNMCLSKCKNKYFKRILGCKIFQYEIASEAEHPSEYCHYGDIARLYPNASFIHLPNPEEILHPTFHQRCQMRCPRKCRRSFYQATLQAQHRGAEKKFEPNVSYVAITLENEALREGGVITLTEVRKYSFTDLISNVGGTMGVFVGSTIMTLAQVLIFFLTYCCEKFR